MGVVTADVREDLAVGVQADRSEWCLGKVVGDVDLGEGVSKGHQVGINEHCRDAAVCLGTV
jgi:hypothetical protein